MDSSVLFEGVHFDKKRFAAEIAKFQKKSEDAESMKGIEIPEANTEDKNKKKRKRKSSDEPVQDFNVFKAPGSEPVATEEAKTQADVEKREHFRKQEVSVALRKKYGLYVSGEAVPPPLQDFDELKSLYKSLYGCKSYLMHNLAQLGFKEPTPIQRQAIPVLLSGRECFACAPTGSGKTLSFVLPILMKLKRMSKDGIRAVILCPTRELAAQTTRECKKLIIGRKFRVRLMTKTLARCADFEKLPCDILVSTPLLLDSVLKKGKLDLSSEEGKLLALRQIFEESLKPPILIFVQSKERAKALYKELAFDEIRVDSIHADLTQTQRERAVEKFREGKTWVLIATDVIARGMDLKEARNKLDSKSRCGRAGRSGEAISLYTEDDVPFLRNIANVMVASGCELPSWILTLPKLRKKKHRPQRDSISTKPSKDRVS